jgi:transcriptional regulator with XRE-family HTH domain
MDAEAFRAARRKLGLTEVGFGEMFGVSRRSVQNWSKKGPPAYIAELLKLALLTCLVGPDRLGVDPAQADAVPVSPALDTLLTSAVAAGWDRGAVLEAVEAWAVVQRQGPQR